MNDENAPAPVPTKNLDFDTRLKEQSSLIESLTARVARLEEAAAGKAKK